MDRCRWTARFVFVLTAAVLVAMCTSAVQAQINGGGGNNGGGNNFNGGNYQNAGVVVDAQGVLRLQRIDDRSGALANRIFAAAMASLDPKLAKWSDLRKISLNRLERAVAKQIESGQPITDDMKNLAGLLRVQYVFFYPETGDIVLAGPAEGFAADPVGRVRGLTTGRAVLQLQDLVTALRAYPPGGDKLNVIGVSIDPTPEGSERLRQTVSSIRGPIVRGQEAQIAESLRQALGMQKVTIQGISPKTHFAQVLVEADYRMKLIGIGVVELPKKLEIRSWASRADSGSIQQMQRWYFVPDYKCVRVTNDGLGMELEGWGVKLVGQSEVVLPGGVRKEVKGESRASKAFCTEFTEHYGALANWEPVYAELRNLIDMSVAAAFIQQKDYYQQANWDLGAFADEGQFPVETYETPKQVTPALNVILKGAGFGVPIGGGVHVEPLQALKSDNVMTDTEGKVSAGYGKVSIKDLPEGQWWWD
jgi:hypothetical protein